MSKLSFIKKRWHFATLPSRIM